MLHHLAGCLLEKPGCSYQHHPWQAECCAEMACMALGKQAVLKKGQEMASLMGHEWSQCSLDPSMHNNSSAIEDELEFLMDELPNKAYCHHNAALRSNAYKRHCLAPARPAAAMPCPAVPLWSINVAFDSSFC